MNSAARLQEIRAFNAGLSEEEKTARADGAFFSNMEDLWAPMSTPIDAAWYSGIVRTCAQGEALYPETINDDNLKHPMAPPSATSDLTNTNQRTTRFDMFRNQGAEKAHLLSNARLCHKAYGYTAEGATGKAKGTKVTRLKLLNGVIREGSSSKLHHTGVKHHKYNKLYLFMQGTYYDSNPPSMLIIPLLPMEDILGWNGTDEYNVMAITFGEDAPFCQMNTLTRAENLTGNAAQVRAFVEQGRQVLEAFVKGLASSNLQHRVEENFEAGEGLTCQPYQQWLRLLAEIRDTRNPKSIDLPQERVGVDWNRVHVATGRASLSNCLPDPYLLAVKAAINYSSFRNQALLPSCPPPPSETSSTGEANTLQGNEDDRHGQGERDASAVARSFQNPNRMIVEFFSAE